jgi:hypothetical protein
LRSAAALRNGFFVQFLQSLASALPRCLLIGQPSILGSLFLADFRQCRVCAEYVVAVVRRADRTLLCHEASHRTTLLVFAAVH